MSRTKATTEVLDLSHTEPPPDPRLAAVMGDDGAVDRAAVEALLSRHPRTLQIPEIEAMQVIFFEEHAFAEDLADVTYERTWLVAFVETTGGTVERETARIGADGHRIVERSVRRFRGRADVRRYRADNQKRHSLITARPRRGAREHRPAATRRTSSSSTSSGTDPGAGSSSDDPAPPERKCAAPWCDRTVYGSTQKKFCGTERCDRARAEERQRKHRTGDLSAVERERLEDARRAGYVGDRAFAPPKRHSLSFLWKHELVVGFDPGEYEALLNRPACRCNGHHIDGGIVGCLKCGLAREAVTS